VAVRRRIDLRDAIGYWIAQVVRRPDRRGYRPAIVNPAADKPLHLFGHAFIAAAVGGAAVHLRPVLCGVERSHEQGPAEPIPSSAWAIGFTVAAGAFAIGGISGGVFNPAVALGGATGGLFAWSTLWIYLVVQLVAGAAAGLVFRSAQPRRQVNRATAPTHE